MLRKLLRIAKKFGIAALFASALFIWQGGWWYVRPLHQWNDVEWRERRLDGCQYFPDSERLVLFQGCNHSSNPLTFGDGFEVVELRTGKTLLSHHHSREDGKLDQKGYFYDGKNTICLLDPDLKQLTIFDLKQLTTRGPLPLPDSFPDARWIGSFSESSSVLYCAQREGSFWKIDLATGNAQLAFTPQIDWSLVGVDGKHAYATDRYRKSIFGWDLQNGAILWARHFDAAHVTSIHPDGFGKSVWYRTSEGFSDGNSLCLRGTDHLVNSLTGEELFSTTWKDAACDKTGLMPAEEENFFTVVRHRYWSSPRFTKTTSVLPLSSDGAEPASLLIVDPTQRRSNRIVQFSQAYQHCPRWSLEIINEHYFALQDYSSNRSDSLDRLEKAKWVPEFALPYWTSWINAMKPVPEHFVFFDPDEPETSRFDLVESGGTQEVIPSQDGQLFVTMDNARTTFRIYALPLKTWWGLRLAISILLPATIFIAIPFGWRRWQIRRDNANSTAIQQSA